MTNNAFDRKITIRDPTLLKAINDSKPKQFKYQKIYTSRDFQAMQNFLREYFRKENQMANLRTWDKCYVPTLIDDFVPRFKCPMCNGTGANLYLRNTKCDCTIHDRDGELYFCHDGSMSIMAKKWIPVEETIDNVYVDVINGESITKYHTKRHGWYMENEIYSTYEEAQATCDKYNELEIPSTSGENY